MILSWVDSISAGVWSSCDQIGVFFQWKPLCSSSSEMITGGRFPAHWECFLFYRSLSAMWCKHWSNWLLINTLHQTDWFPIAYCTYIFHLKPERCKHILLFCKTFLVILCSVVQFIFSSAVRTVSTLLELQRSVDR